MKATNTTDITLNIAETMGKLAESKIIGETAVIAAETSKELANEAMVTLRKHKVKVGYLNKKCAAALAFSDAMTNRVSPKSGKPYTKQSISNMLADIRHALDNGKPLVWNYSRKTDAKDKPAGQASTPAKKDKAKLAEGKSDLTTREKVLVQLENCVTILQNSDDADFDVPEILADIQALIQSLE